MKKAYVTPSAKMYDIRMEEKIAASCFGYLNKNFSGYGCDQVIMGDNVGKSLGDQGCYQWLTQNS